jgi:CRP-like cAMP-binding protein
VWCKSVTYKKGAVIFHKTDLSTDLYILNSGRVKSVLADDEGDEIVLAQCKGFLRVGKLTHKELAARIGSSREAVTKCIRYFRRRELSRKPRAIS